jgi:hypothetical protein
VSKKVIGLAAALVLLVSATASAQWRGMGRTGGKVVDESGTAVADVTVRADLKGVGGTTLKTNEKGEWTLSGVAAGEWSLTIAKDGMEMVKAKVLVEEMKAPTFLKTTMKKVVQ